MRTREYILGIVVLTCTAITISLLMRSCKLSEADSLKNEIRKNEEAIRAIQTKRDSANRAVIPFNDAQRDSVMESVKRKTGLNLHLRK